MKVLTGNTKEVFEEMCNPNDCLLTIDCDDCTLKSCKLRRVNVDEVEGGSGHAE